MTEEVPLDNLRRKWRTGGSGVSVTRLVYACSNTHSRNGHRVPAPRLDNEVWTELLKLADHIALIEEAVKLASHRDNSAANLKAVERALAEWNDKVELCI